MNLPEVVWRLRQKLIQQEERKRFANRKISVGGEVWNTTLSSLSFDKNALGINWKNKEFDVQTRIHFLQGPDLNKWPDTFSYDLDYKQRDDLGDARTNWEKNRHFEWALLAKVYFVSRDEMYFRQLQSKVNDWCKGNSFLHGISWTSAMEVAIRAINWMYALAFVREAGKDIPSLSVGVINMVDYLLI